MDGDAGASAGFALPVGTVTLLLADIEGSTKLWEQRADEMPKAIAALDEVVADAVGRHEGVRPVEQGEGDSFVAAFARASDAVGCALALQQATRGGLLRLRIGVHTGEVQLRDEGNYVGPAVNRTARIRDTGHGGQVLVSQAVTELVQDQLPAGAALVELGVHRLKDLGRPEHIWQLNADGDSEQFPPLRGLDAITNNLPVQLTSFVGRRSQIDDVHNVLNDARVVTLTGAGGCGKTRLALQVAADRLDAHTDGVWLVDLSQLNEPDAVASAVAAALSLVERPGRSALDAVAGAIAEGAVLLVLDNCEHLVAACAEITETLLRRCPRLTMLATSREPLGVAGEITFRVPSLAVPDANDPTPVEALRHYGAVELFVERAGRARPGFALDSSVAEAVTEICRRLDGIPLAIELAAARMRILTAAQIRDGLHDRFRLLTGGGRTAVPRQQTLQASVDWSYALLLDAERLLLRRLSVFAGGFTLAAAETVGAGEPLMPHHVFDLLSQLVDKSLVVSDGDGRFLLLETVRQYGADRLADSGEADATRQRHYDFCLHVARPWSDADDDDDDLYRTRVRDDYDNIRRALQWSSQEDDPALVAELAHRLTQYWGPGNNLSEGRRWTGAAVEAAAEARPDVRARILWSHARLLDAAAQGGAALPFAEEALGLARELGDQRVVALALLQLASSGHPMGSQYLEEGLGLATETGDADAQAWAWLVAGMASFTADGAVAGHALRQSIEAAQRGRFRHVERTAATLLGVLSFYEGDTREGLSLLEDCLPHTRERGDNLMLAEVLLGVAGLRSLVGDHDLAEAAVTELEALAAELREPGITVRLAFARGFRALILGEWAAAAEAFADPAVADAPLLGPTLLVLSALPEVLGGDPETALRHLSEAAGGWLSPVAVRMPDLITALAAQAQGQLSEADDLARRTVAASFEHPTTTRWFAVEVIAAVAAQQGSYEEAARIFGAVDAHSVRQGVSTETPFYVAFAHGQIDAAREALGAARFDEVWAEGAAMSQEELLAYIQRGRGERKRPTAGWESLTPTERQVVDLVVDGLTNKAIGERLFIALPTVKSHLTHVYGKLGMSSRAELSAAAARRQ